jgi:endonuclease YncB( thermonuclease family)
MKSLTNFREDLGAFLLCRGHAWVYTKYVTELPPETQSLYAQEMAHAQSMSHGVWQQWNPIPPWEWRHGK